MVETGWSSSSGQRAPWDMTYFAEAEAVAKLSPSWLLVATSERSPRLCSVPRTACSLCQRDRDWTTPQLELELVELKLAHWACYREWQLSHVEHTT